MSSSSRIGSSSGTLVRLPFFGVVDKEEEEGKEGSDSDEEEEEEEEDESLLSESLLSELLEEDSSTITIFWRLDGGSTTAVGACFFWGDANEVVGGRVFGGVVAFVVSAVWCGDGVFAARVMFVFCFVGNECDCVVECCRGKSCSFLLDDSVPLVVTCSGDLCCSKTCSICNCWWMSFFGILAGFGLLVPCCWAGRGAAESCCKYFWTSSNTDCACWKKCWFGSGEGDAEGIGGIGEGNAGFWSCCSWESNRFAWPVWKDLVTQSRNKIIIQTLGCGELHGPGSLRKEAQ